MKKDKHSIPHNFCDRIKNLRQKLDLTQTQLANLLGISFATVNRWENNQTQPSLSTWRKLLMAEKYGLDFLTKATLYDNPEMYESLIVKDAAAFYCSEIENIPFIDFSAHPEIVRLKVEAERLSHCHLYNPRFASEISLIDPLPHQIIAVYEHMLPEARLRFLLADDAGAGKTIMAGLYLREMLMRRLIHRILVVPPAGLVGNWKRELRTLFNLSFKTVMGNDAKSSNPFTGPESNHLIASLDTLAGERMFSRLQAPDVKPYDVIIFDEAHKLSADREPDFRIRKTDRYRLAECLAGISNGDDRWKLEWNSHHLILLSATPHMGKDMPYYFLWRLLEPEILSTFEAFKAYPQEFRKKHFIRRTKEEMVDFNEVPLYPKRRSATVSFDLTQGRTSEQALYDETTVYIREHYNRARILNRSAARLAMTIFQRRLASSTYALMQSFKRRLGKINQWIDDLANKKVTFEQLLSYQHYLEKQQLDVTDKKTADEEDPENGVEENEIAENTTIEAIALSSIKDLEEERKKVAHLLHMTEQLLHTGKESKFERLIRIFDNPHFKCEKMIIFTEHRDTLNFIVRRLESLGFTDRIASIHGGMDFRERERQVRFFKQSENEGGAQYLIATDAAGEGINLQFCWLMINYDIPWNPARLEQRMGRIHRYGQRHDPVIIVNIVAGKTREGSVLKVLLDKMERIRRELGSDKIFDVIGRLFENKSLREYMEEALVEDNAELVKEEIVKAITPSNVEAIEKSEQMIYGDGGDIKNEIDRVKHSMEQELHRHLLPGYIRRFIEKAAPIIDLGIEGDLEGSFSFGALQPQAFDLLLSLFDDSAETQQNRFSIHKPTIKGKEIFLHPGEPFFDRLLNIVKKKIAREAMKGSVLIDPCATRPYFFHLLQIVIEREPDPSFGQLKNREVVDRYLLALKQELGGTIEECPIEHLLILKGGKGIPREAIHFASMISKYCEQAKAFAVENYARFKAEKRREKIHSTISEREAFLRQGYAYKDAELAKARTRLNEKVRDGNTAARNEIEKIKQKQKELWDNLEHSLVVLKREPELVAPGDVIFLAHTLIVPSSSNDDKKKYDEHIEKIAMNVVKAYEEERGSVARDVSTAELARNAGVPEYPGFDFLAIQSSGTERDIEVKGRAGIGDIELTENEWVKACNLRDKYWLYVVFNCATAHPKLLRIKDPFTKLLVKTKGGVVVGEQEIINASEEGD